jgi:hypothetical protein
MTEVEVDQSGKIEDLAVDTVLAFADGLCWAIRIPAAVKRSGLSFLRQRRVRRKSIYIRMLAAGLYLLLREHLAQLAYTTIDVEFDGREEDLRGALLNMIWRQFRSFSKDRLILRRIGKRSPAHHAALTTYQGKRPADKVITEAEFIGALK